MPASHSIPEHSVMFINRAFGGGEGWGPRREPCNTIEQRGMETMTGPQSVFQKGTSSGAWTWSRGRESRKQSARGVLSVSLPWPWVSCLSQGEPCIADRVRCVRAPSASLGSNLPGVSREGVSTLRFPLLRLQRIIAVGKGNLGWQEGDFFGDQHFVD